MSLSLPRCSSSCKNIFSLVCLFPKPLQEYYTDNRDLIIQKMFCKSCEDWALLIVNCGSFVFGTVSFYEFGKRPPNAEVELTASIIFIITLILQVSHFVLRQNNLRASLATFWRDQIERNRTITFYCPVEESQSSISGDQDRKSDFIAGDRQPSIELDDSVPSSPNSRAELYPAHAEESRNPIHEMAEERRWETYSITVSSNEDAIRFFVLVMSALPNYHCCGVYSCKETWSPVLHVCCNKRPDSNPYDSDPNTVSEREAIENFQTDVNRRGFCVHSSLSKLIVIPYEIFLMEWAVYFSAYEYAALKDCNERPLCAFNEDDRQQLLPMKTAFIILTCLRWLWCMGGWYYYYARCHAAFRFGVETRRSSLEGKSFSLGNQV